jgi:RNA polymerase sigma-70 factor, ECF subfamily
MEHSPEAGSVEGRRASAEERRLVQALCAGEDDAFIQLVRLHGPAMLRVARLYVSSTAVAEEVVQETWLAVLTGIGRYEGRSSFKTWLFRILRNQAQTRGLKEGRSVPFTALGEETGPGEPAVDAERFRGAGERFADHWSSSPQRWTELPEESVLSAETIELVERAAALLPPPQRVVITLRDILGWDADEVCELLEITATNQRVLLHRARTKVRKALEEHLAPT